MNYKDIPKENKTEILEQAVINEHYQALEWIFYDLGEVEMTARALGLACRFCGYEAVKVLVEGGATFAIPKNEKVEQHYHCYSGMKYANYRSNYALYLLNITKQIKGATCCKGLRFPVQAAKSDRTYRQLRSDSERAKVLKYLCENKDRISFNPSELLYYAIFAEDSFIVEELKKRGVKLLDKRVDIMTDGGRISDSYWFEWSKMMSKLDDSSYLPVMKRLKEEIGGRYFHCSGKVYDITKDRFSNDSILDFFCASFKTDKLNKTQLLRDLIDANAVRSLSIAEKLGWLSNLRRRDEMIEYARRSENHVECLAFLLDFKNRTADFAAEREKAEKKALRELNADPNSVTELKKIWSFKTQEDGTLIITGYKGKQTDVTVPSMIGKKAVTAIGKSAFSSTAPRLDSEQAELRESITKVILPDGIRSIGEFAFYLCRKLSDINFPDSVVEIGDCAFTSCDLSEIAVPDTVKKLGTNVFSSCHKLHTAVLPKNITEIGSQMFGNCSTLKNITIPAGVRKIGSGAFASCHSLERLVIPDGVTEIGRFAFQDCTELKAVVIPASVIKITNDFHSYPQTKMGTVFQYCFVVTVYVEPDSYAEQYCQFHQIAYRYVKDYKSG